MSESPAKQDESRSENRSERDPTVRPELTDGTKAVTLPGATLQPAVRGAAGGLYPKIVLALLVATLLSLGAGAAVFRLVTYRTFNEIRIEVIKDLRRIVHHSYNEIAAQESNRNRIQRDLAEKFSSLRQIHIQVEPVPETAGTIDDVEVRQAGHGFVTWFDEGSNRVTIRGEGVIADLAPAVTRGFFASGMTIIMVVSACGAFVFSSVRRRLSRLIEAHDRVAAGNRESRIRDTIDDELGDLGRSFDQMVDDLAKHEARIDQLQSQRRDFLSDISHELKTPITSLRGHLEGMIGSSDPKRDPVHLIYEEAERLSRLVEDLLQLARFESDRFVMRREECVLQRIASRSVERLRIAAANRSVELLTDLAPEPVRRAVDPQRFEQILGNLVDNALRHSPPGGKVQIAVSEDATEAIILVDDDGPGVPVADRTALFERFRSSESDPSRGLGLTIVADLIQAHGGTVRLEQSPSGGLRVRIGIP